MKKKILLIFVVALAVFTRFYKLGTFPALNADEAAIGYNAYSLLETGKDEHGNPWPIHFQSFNDYKPGGFFYIVLPFVKLLGLNTWAVRIPGALLGVGSVLLVYFLAKELFGDEKVGLLASLLLAISPWHIHFSRGGWEVNAATFFITLGVLLFVKKKYFGSGLSFVSSLYIYHAARVVVPVLGLFMVLFYSKDIKGKLSKALVAGAIGLLAVLPLAKDFFSGAVAQRAVGVGIFSDLGPVSRVLEQRGEHKDPGGVAARLLHNKPVNYALSFLSNWAAHFEGNFLFISGDEIQRNKVPDMGQVYLVLFPFLLLGVLKLSKKWGKSEKLVFTWLILAPLAAAFTFQSPHALRSHNMVIPLTITAALGVSAIKKPLFKWLVILLVFLSFIRYENLYWTKMATDYPFSSQYGVKELVDFVNREDTGQYKNIVVTTRYDQPYISLFVFGS